MEELNQRKEKRIDGLDSLRFLAFLMVFLFHTSDIFFFGFLGVDFFFVLSSFILTYLANLEIEKTSKFSKRNFFIRRVLRIFPLYYLVLAFSLLVLPALASIFEVEITLPAKEWYFWFFLSNYDNDQYLLPLKFLWSIAVEEQFYLLFLILSIFFTKNFWYVIFVLLTVYIIHAASDAYFGWEQYKTVSFHLVNFSFGMAAGYLYFQNRLSHKFLKSKILFPLFFVVSALIYASVDYSMLFNIFLSLDFVLLIFITIKVTLERQGTSLVFRTTEYLGKYTYGLYVYSGFVIVFCNIFLGIENKILKVLIELILLFIISFFSYHLFEKQFLKLKKIYRKV
ncbi:acyltransferase family protein [Autumnicola lenta]|uniref:acyltransferase family protein n=1 Tax=Autumnicola lenta TaxID=3075593 RepID=UPI003D77B533